MLYKKGIGIEQDCHQAYKWFLKAAEQNHAEAQFNLARMYERGVGVERNRAEAYKWFFNADQLGFPVSKKDKN
jgi:TPR repeat protein